MDKLRQKIVELLGLKDKDVPEGKGFEGFTGEQLEAAEKAARENFATAKDAKETKVAKELAEFIKATMAETTARTEAEAATEKELADLEAEITVSDPDPAGGDGGEGGDNGDGGEGGNGNGEGEGEGQGDGGDANPSQPETVTSPTADAPAAQPVAASINVNGNFDPKAIAAAVAKELGIEKIDAAAAPKAPAVPEPTDAAKPITELVKLTAAGDVNGHSAGGEMKPDALGKVFTEKAEATLRARDGRKTVVASMHWDEQYDSSRTLKRGDAEGNTEKIMKAVAEAQEMTAENLRAIRAATTVEEIERLAAEGGLCAPVNVRYDIFTVGTDERPLRDSYVRFNADRGGIRFNAPPTLADIPAADASDGAVNIYTAADDTEGTRYPKECLRIECGADTEVHVDGVVLCMIAGTYSRMFHPENFRAWWGLGRVRHSRRAETKLWDRMETLSSSVTAISAGNELSAVPDILATVDKAIAQYRFRHRVSPATPLRVRTQAWVQDYMRADLSRRAGEIENFEVGNARLARWFAVRNTAVTFILDANSPGGTSGDVQAEAALNPWPDAVELNIAIDGTFLFLDGGRLDFGTEIRDWDLIRNNDAGAFMETFENLAFVGPEALHISIDTCPRGETAGVNNDYDPCTGGS